MKNNYKKILSLLLALVMVFSLVACGGNNKKTDSDTSKETTAEGKDKKMAEGSLKGEISVQAEEGWVEYYNAAIKKITDANPEAKINVIQTGSFDHLKVIDSTDATNKDVADVFAIPADRYTGMAENDILAPLPAKEMAAELGGWDNFESGLGGIFKTGDEFLAFPLNIETLVTFVNSANAKTAGIDTTKPIEVTSQKDAATVLLPLFDAWYGVAPNNAGGINLLAKDDKGLSSTYTKQYSELSADEKTVFDAIYGYWKLNNDSGTTLFDPEAGWGYVDGQFATGGKGVVRLGGPWDASSMQKQAGEGNLEVYPIGQITLGGKPLTHWQGGWGLAINSRIEKDADKMALAQALIKELVNPENAVALYKATGKILENVKVDVYKNSDLSDLDKKVVENVIASFEVSPARPIFKEYGNVWDTWKNAVLSWNSVKPADAEAAYKELNAAFTQMMEQINSKAN